MRNKATHIGLLFFGLVGILPFMAALSYAALYSVGLVGAANEGLSWQFWSSVWSSGEFLDSFIYSTLIAAVSVVLSVGGALWICLQLREYLSRPIWAFIMYLPLAIPGIVAAFFAVQMLAKAGILARIAYQLGWIAEAREFPDLINDSYAIGIVLTFVSLVLPFFVLLFLNVYQNERIGELATLATSLGAKRRQVLWRVSLPLLLHKTKVLIILYFIFLLGAYEVPLILGQESPQMLSVLIIREIKQYDLTKISEGYVIAVIYTVVVSLVTILLFARKNSAHEV